MLKRIKQMLSRSTAHRERRLSPTSRLGRLGEGEAARHLKAEGYRILERNYRVKQGEIDLVAFRDGVLAFVEVRAQTQPSPIDALETITRRKQRRVIKAAQTYATVNKLGESDVALRFDVVTVLFDQGGRRVSVTHLEDAFQVQTRGLS
jgi:putative endonuclease